MTAPALLTVDQAVAEIFGESNQSHRKTLYKLIKAGQIEAIRANENNSKYWIPLRAIKALRGEDD